MTTSWGTVTLGYDAAGRVATVTAPDGGALTYAYDGPLTTSETTRGTFTGTVAWTWDNDFRVASTIVNGSSISYRYDADSLLTGAGALAISREAATGRVSGTALGAVTTTLGYSDYGELASLGASAGGSGVFSCSFTRDLAGRITGKTETVQGATDTYLYGYDDAGRLATVSKNGHQTASYFYDDNGNRLSKTSDQGTETGSYDDQDRMVAYAGASYAYRPNGELAAKSVGGQTTLYDYDALGNLRAAVLPDGRQLEYVVDGLNRRVGKKGNGALVEGFLYDGQLRPVAWLDGAGAVKATFVYGLHVNVPEYMTTSAGTFRIIHDHLGSPRLVVNTSTGAVAQRIDYDEWGNVTYDSNPGAQPFGFAGGLYDRDTGLVRFGARDYDPQTGRWTNKDPIRFDGGRNLYRYAAGDPVNFIDPDGTELIMAGFGALAGGLINGIYVSTHGGSFWKGFGVGAIAGGVAGLVGNPFLAGAIAGGLTTFGNRNLVLPCDNTPAPLAYGLGIGLGAVGGGLGSWAGEAMGQASGGIGTPLAASEVMGKIGSQVGGVIGGTATNNAIDLWQFFDAI